MVCLVIYYNTKEKDIYKYISKKKKITNQLNQLNK